MEILWATLKKELVQHAKFKTRAQARSSIFEWIEVWYQRERSHSSLAVSCCLIGSLGPEQFEAARRVGSYDCVSTESGEVQLRTLDDGQLLRRGSIHMLTNEWAMCYCRYSCAGLKQE